VAIKSLQVMGLLTKSHMVQLEISPAARGVGVCITSSVFAAVPWPNVS
jgi:hypothetical protein